MKIKLLSNKTINKIAAGEVVERPSSAVKELVENAIDSGANKIHINLEQSGKNLISISDNGQGMSPEDLQIAVQRHATSKLNEDDLLDIQNFGFRGEALPAIGAVSRMRITSKTNEQEYASTIYIEGGTVSDVSKANRVNGTTVEVRDLFYATPARLKFLRSDRSELASIKEIVKRLALSHPSIEFCLQHEQKTILRLRAQPDDDYFTQIKQRASDVLGTEFNENSCEVNFAKDHIEIYGFTSLPTFNRATGEEQFLFVNNRPLKDKLLNIALKVAYQDFMARDRFAICAIFIKMPSNLVDVNVHPAKTEVRFYDPQSTRGMLISAVKEALSKTGHRVSNHLAGSALTYMQNSKSKYTDYPWASSTYANTSEKSFSQPSSVSENNNFKNFRVAPGPENIPPQSSNEQFSQMAIEPVVNLAPTARIYDESTLQAHLYPLGAAKAQLFNTYIVAESQNGLVLVDQHAAHERLGYEKIKQQIANNGLIAQRLLIPEIIELPSQELADTIIENQENLSKLALVVESFGGKNIIVNQIPSIIGDVDVKKLINDIAEHLYQSGENIALTQLIEHVTETYACHYAIRAGRKLSINEMNEMLRQMEATDFSGQCNHGRPTYTELQKVDIEKLFGRR